MDVSAHLPRSSFSTLDRDRASLDQLNMSEFSIHKHRQDEGEGMD